MKTSACKILRSRCAIITYWTGFQNPYLELLVSFLYEKEYTALKKCDTGEKTTNNTGSSSRNRSYILYERPLSIETEESSNPIT